MGFKKIIFGFIALTIGLLASQDYAEGMKYYDTKQYDKAFHIILKVSKEGVNKAAQYRLGEMYEKGLGTKVDYKESAHWYKKAASKYAYVNKKKAIDTNSSFLTKLDKWVSSNDDIKAGDEFVLSKLNTDTVEAKSFLTSLLDGDFFGLRPHKVNYLLPLSYSADKPNRVDPIFGHNGIPDQNNQYNKNTEVVFQLSIKKQLMYNIFGLNEFIGFGYTQKVWWQLYDESAPFRETNYQPEVFMTIPTSKNIDDAIGLKGVRLGFVHESNGEEGYKSRSWNRLYATGMWQWDNLFLATRVWHRLKEDRRPDWYYEQTENDPAVIQQYSSGDDNPDIEDYLGYGDIEVIYLYGKSQFGLLLRNNLDFDNNKGAIELTYSRPFFNSPNTFWYAKVFNGYGESLIDYNVNVTKASFGFSFSGALF